MNKLKIFIVIVGITAPLLAFQNCGKKADETVNSMDVLPGETYVEPLAVKKTDRILHSRSTANFLVQALGISNGQNVDSLTDFTLQLQLLLSETGEYDSITGGLLTVQTEIAEEACQHMIFDEERGKLTIDNNVVTDKRRIFKGIYIGENAPPANYDSTTLEIKDTGLYPSYENLARYREAIKRLAVSLWKRHSLTTEEDQILGIVQPVIAGSNNNRGYRASVMICTVMATTFNSMSQ
jgi:hypothetical protein